MDAFQSAVYSTCWTRSGGLVTAEPGAAPPARARLTTGSTPTSGRRCFPRRRCRWRRPVRPADRRARRGAGRPAAALPGIWPQQTASARARRTRSSRPVAAPTSSPAAGPTPTRARRSSSTPRVAPIRSSATDAAELPGLRRLPGRRRARHLGEAVRLRRQPVPGRGALAAQAGRRPVVRRLRGRPRRRPSWR